MNVLKSRIQVRISIPSAREQLLISKLCQFSIIQHTIWFLGFGPISFHESDKPSLFLHFSLYKTLQLELLPQYVFFLSALTRKRIDLRSMLGVYVVMSVGLILALMALTAEIFWTRMKERKIITQRLVRVIGTKQDSAWQDDINYTCMICLRI